MTLIPIVTKLSVQVFRNLMRKKKELLKKDWC